MCVRRLSFYRRDPAADRRDRGRDVGDIIANYRTQQECKSLIARSLLRLSESSDPANSGESERRKLDRVGSLPPSPSLRIRPSPPKVTAAAGRQASFSPFLCRSAGASGAQRLNVSQLVRRSRSSLSQSPICRVLSSHMPRRNRGLCRGLCARCPSCAASRSAHRQRSTPH
jgi:hypothetical protein